MFSIIRPGMPMEEVDATIRRYNAERLVEAGVLRSVDEIGKLMCTAVHITSATMCTMW